MSGAPHAFLPDPVQELLLKACLGSGEEVVGYWERWRRQIDLDDLDEGSQRLIPLLYRQLRAAGVGPHPLLEKYGGIYKRSWYRNGLLLKEAASLLHAFNEAGIPTIVLKGIALSLLYYPDRGARPMADIDLLVPLSHARAAVELLHATNWTATRREAPVLFTGHPELFPAVLFLKGGRAELDLHCHALARCVGVAAHRDFWSWSRAVDFDGVPTRVLDDTAQLLQVCVHGACWNAVPPFRWVADAALIIKRGRVDWRRLRVDALRHQLVLPLLETLGYLSGKMACPVPAEFLDAMRMADVPAAYRREHLAVQTPDFIGSPWHSLWFYYARYLRSLDGGNSAGPLAVIRYVRSLFQGPLPLVFASKLRRDLHQRFARLFRSRSIQWRSVLQTSPPIEKHPEKETRAS